MATTFFAYEEYKVLFANVFDHRWPAVNESLAGSAAGITAVALTYPLDLVRARLAMQENAKAQPHLQYRYRGVFDALVSIPRQEGPAALYRGISAAVVGVVPYAGIKFSAYEALKRVAMTLFSKSEADLPVSVRMGCGGLAGLLAQTFTYPFDVLRRRAQTGRQPYPNVVVGIVQLAREEGVRRGLYRGLSLNYLKTLPNVMIYMSLYDIFKARLLKLSQHNRI
jgi:hypothetical protein